MTRATTMTIKAVILPLDGLVFANSVGEYARVYRQPGAASADREWATVARSALAQLRSEERSLSQNNYDFLMSALRRELGISAAKLAGIQAQFCRSIQPLLREQSTPAAGLATLLAVIAEQGWQRALLADCHFPEAAIRQRLARAGLAAEHWDFLAHAQSVHFAGPSPALLAELVARLGVEPDEALYLAAAGDERGICAARVAGLPLLPHADAAELARQLAGPGEFPAPPLTREQVIAELRGNLGALYGLLAEVRPDQWHMHPQADEWSIMQILCHLLQSEREEELPRLRRILDEDVPFLAAPAPAKGADAPPCAREGAPVAEAFAAARGETLAFLSELSEQDWRRRARHSIFGPTDLLEMAHFTAQHDRLHLNQICQTLGKCD